MEMQISCCKLTKKTQDRLLEYFVLEVTARSAADTLVIHPNSAALFYHKNREIITYHLDAENESCESIMASPENTSTCF